MRAKSLVPDIHGALAFSLLIGCIGRTSTFNEKVITMKSLLAFAAVCVCLVLNSGCSEHSTTTKKEEITTPGGKTTITTQQDVKKTGDHKDNK